MTPKNIPSSDTDDQAGGVQSIEKRDGHDYHGWSNPRAAWLRYAAAVGIVAVAVALPMVFMPTLGTRFPFITLFPAVILAALFGGLGLGLPISSAIVTAHGGEIKAESQGRGEGAEFTVTLGSVPAPAASSPPDAAPVEPARALALLVVEDHEATRMVLERLLTRSGHMVVTAATVHDALAAYKAAHFDAVISDLGLPDGSGIDLMVQIQNIRPVPAIALSGYGMEDDIHRSKAAGFFAHLVKPVKVEQLKQLLTQIPARAGHLDNA